MQHLNKQKLYVCMYLRTYVCIYVGKGMKDETSTIFLYEKFTIVM